MIECADTDFPEPELANECYDFPRPNLKTEALDRGNSHRVGGETDMKVFDLQQRSGR